MRMGFWTWDSDGKTPADTVNHSYTPLSFLLPKFTVVNCH